MKRVRVGVVGVGKLGQHHARVYSELSKAELVGVVDIDEEKVRAIAKRCNTQPYTYYKYLIDKVDAVSIAVPTDLHYRIALDFINKGVNVLIEKPVTSTIQEARILVDAAHKNDVILQVGHIERFNSAFIALKKVIKDPIFISSYRLGPFSPRVSDIGVVLDLMIHDIDIVTSIANYKIENIDAYGRSIFTNKEDIANAQITFENGLFATITASRISQRKIRRLEITEIDKFIVLDYIKQELFVYPESKGNGNKIIKVEIEKQEPLKLELEHFLNCVKNGEKPIVGIEEGMNALDIALKITEHIRKKNHFHASLYSYSPYIETFKGLH